MDFENCFRTAPGNNVTTVTAIQDKCLGWTVIEVCHLYRNIKVVEWKSESFLQYAIT